MKLNILFFVAAVLVVGAFLQAHEPDTPGKKFNGRFLVDVKKVVDGDTVWLMFEHGRESCRLIGIDTPETVHPSKPVEYYGPEASTFLKNLLKGETVWAEVAGRGRYGRPLVYLYRFNDGLFINLEIIRQGYGEAYTKFEFDKESEFVAMEEKAKELKKGMWGE